jgi:hypothetical protein
MQPASQRAQGQPLNQRPVGRCRQSARCRLYRRPSRSTSTARLSPLWVATGGRNATGPARPIGLPRLLALGIIPHRNTSTTSSHPPGRAARSLRSPALKTRGSAPELTVTDPLSWVFGAWFGPLELNEKERSARIDRWRSPLRAPQRLPMPRARLQTERRRERRQRPLPSGPPRDARGGGGAARCASRCRPDTSKRSAGLRFHPDRTVRLACAIA